VTELASSLEGKHRPGHFDGVCVVVAKLLNIVQADRAYFGMKDFQQLQIVKRLVSDLNIPTEIVSCPTLRESDGLAMSSRNVRLTPEQRSAATVLYKALSAGRKMVIDDKVTDPPIILHYMRTIINTEPLALLEYAEVVDQETLKPVNYINGECAPIALLAARFGDIRLIDNMILSSDSS
jgi:pantoate--beta-alanine ligase